MGSSVSTRPPQNLCPRTPVINVCTPLTPHDGNLRIALPLVFHNFHFMLQNKRRIDKMFPSLLDFLMGAAYIIIFGAFEFFCGKLQLFDPGALIGMGVFGSNQRGLIGFLWQRWDWIIAVVLCLLGGCIGSGVYRFNKKPSNSDRKAVGR